MVEFDTISPQTIVVPGNCGIKQILDCSHGIRRAIKGIFIIPSELYIIKRLGDDHLFETIGRANAAKLCIVKEGFQ
jgi:hypothetical protein